MAFQAFNPLRTVFDDGFVDFSESPVYRSIDSSIASASRAQSAPSRMPKDDPLGIPSFTSSRHQLGGWFGKNLEFAATTYGSVRDSDRVPKSAPSEPMMMERYCTFVSLLGLGELWTTLTSTLKQLNVLFETDIENAQIDAQAVDKKNYHALDIRISVFTRKSDSGFFVECQRRRGDCIAFSRFYERLMATVTGKESLRSAEAAVAMDTEDEFLSQRPSVENSPVILDSLIQMMSSPYAEVQCEGVRAMASLLQNPSNKKFVLADHPKVSLTLQRLIQSADSHTNRSALIGLAHLLGCADATAYACRSRCGDETLRFARTVLPTLIAVC